MVKIKNIISTKALKICSLILFIAVVLTSGISASDLTWKEDKGCWMCLRARPLPKCKSFWITEAGVFYRLIHEPKLEGNYYFTGELGHMINRNERSALGGTIFLGVNTEESYRLGLKPRYRRWISSKLSLDFSPGILLLGDDDSYKPDLPGFTGHIGLCYEDWLVLTTQLEIIHFKRFGTDVAWYGGAKLGSYPGLAVFIGLPIAALIIGAMIGSIDIDIGQGM